MEVLHMIPNTYNRLMAQADPRVADWPLMSGPLPTMIICACYVLTVKIIGPRLMRNREPFDMRIPMIIYNMVMVFVSATIVYQFSVNAWFYNYSFICQPVDYSNSPQGLLVAKVSYLYFLAKFVEFIDTLFFVLRKKQQQISNLHVIHHGILPFSVWWGMKFVPGGHATFFGYVNSFIHVIMYTYYGLAALGPKVQKYLWWKKYLTVFQMIQFVMIFTHAFQLLVQTQCDFPKVFALWIGAHGVLFWFLFSNFYESTYNKKRKDGQNGSAVRSSNGLANAAAFVGMCSGKQHLLHQNGKSNGHSNGYSNGHSNGYSNGHSKSNGNGVHQKDGVNGHCNGLTNGNGQTYSNGQNGHSKTNGLKLE